MANTGLGTLTLSLVVKAGAFTAGMTAAERQANKSLSAIEKRAYKFGQAVGTSIKAGSVLAVAALGTIALAVGKAIDSADQIRDLSIRLGTSTETLSAFGYAASQTGTDLDTLGRGMKILAKNAADALKPTSEQAQIFDALGISVTDVTGKLKDQSVLIPEIATAFKGMEDGTTKTALALALFGKSGTEMIEFLNQGADGLADFEDKARSLGVVIDSETASAADEFNDILGDLKAIVSGGALTIAKELLPALKEGATDLKRLANEGELASNIASVLNTVVKAGVGTFDVYNLAVARASIQLEGFMGVMAGAKEVQSNFGSFGLSDGSVMEGMKKITDAAKKENQALKELEARFQNRDRFSGVTITSESTYGGGGNVDRGKLNNALAGIGGGGSKKSSRGGKSDAEKETDKLKAAYDRMNESLTEQIGLFGVTGEAAKLRYELEHGELSKLTEAQKQELLNKAERIDLLNKEADAEEALVKARAEQDRDFNNVNDAIKEQILLTGMSRDEMEIYNNLAAAGVDSESARGQEIIENTRLLQSMSEAMADQIEIMDSLREAGSDFLVDLGNGVKPIDALTDAWERMRQKLLQMASDQLMDKIFGKQGDPAGGSSGGWLSSLFSAFGGSGGGGESAGSIMDLFGGAWGFANGGKTAPWSVSRVNERGFEMATVGGNDYLLTGKDSVAITPHERLRGGSGVVVNNQFVVGPQNKQITQEQIANRTAFELQESQRRNR